MSNPNSNLLLDMLRYKRPEGSATQTMFCQKYLEPVLGPPDLNGNYILVVGPPSPRIAFMAHHDTIHTSGGMQTLHVTDGFVGLSRKSKPKQQFRMKPGSKSNSKSNCLGADCTTGVWLILHMIANDVPGRYVIHAGEECGGIGANALMKDPQAVWIDDTDVAIEFDRFGTNSIITHQCARRTASDEFASSLSNILGMDHRIDTGGIFTDSEVYAESIPECTNLSVGYNQHHTSGEYQDIDYAVELAAALVDADWSQLVVARDPKVVEYEGWGRGGWDDDPYDLRTGTGSSDMGLIYLVEDNPGGIAELLESIGWTDVEVAEYLGLTVDKGRVVM